MDYIRRLREVDELLSPAQRHVIANVCGYDERVKDKDDMKTLRRALDIAAKHWGYTIKNPEDRKRNG